MNTRTARRFKNNLNKQITELMATIRADGFDSGAASESFADPCDSASVELSNRSTVFSREREAQMILQLRRTINRIDAGEFGTCRSCGSRISEKRLLANPTAELCIDCKAEQEKKGTHETDS